MKRSTLYVVAGLAIFTAYMAYRAHQAKAVADVTKATGVGGAFNLAKFTL